MTPPRRENSDLDVMLAAYMAEDNPTDGQTARLVTTMAMTIKALQHDIEELKEDRKEENSARIQIMQAKRGTFEIVQFAATSITALAMFVIALVELYTRSK